VQGCPHRVLPHYIVVIGRQVDIMLSVRTGSSVQEGVVVEP